MNSETLQTATSDEALEIRLEANTRVLFRRRITEIETLRYADGASAALPFKWVPFGESLQWQISQAGPASITKPLLRREAFGKIVFHLPVTSSNGVQGKTYMNTAGAFTEAIERAVEAGLRKAMNISEATNRRLLSAEASAIYLGLSRREVYNMIANKELQAVKHGRRTMLDVRDLDEWIERNKK